MWFKNLRVYRMPAHWAMTAEQIATALRTQLYAPLQSFEVLTHGWVPTRDDQLVHTVNGQMLLTLCTEKKLLPASVIKEAVRERAAELADQQGFKPGRKQLKELKEQVTDDLLPRAFSTVTNTRVWIDPVHGWLVVDAASPSRSDTVVKMLIKSFEKLPLETLYLARSPLAVMTDWLAFDEAPGGFTVDQDTELRSNGEGKATVRYTRHSLDAEDVRRHIATGKQCTRLALTWADRISFVVHADFAIKRLAPLDVLKEDGATPGDEQERFDTDFVLMTGELNRMLSSLLEAFGGEKPREPDTK